MMPIREADEIPLEELQATADLWDRIQENAIHIPNRLEIAVTRELIEDGTPSSNTLHPVAKAIAQALPKAENNVHIAPANAQQHEQGGQASECGRIIIRQPSDLNLTDTEYRLEKAVNDWLINYQEGHEARPFALVLIKPGKEGGYDNRANLLRWLDQAD